MSNFLGIGKPKIQFEWDGETKTFEPDHNRIQFFPKFNIQEQRIHKSVLNGATTKEHLGFYHEAELYYHSITSGEYEDVLRFLEVVDSLTLTPFTDNQDFTIEMLIEKAYAYEFENVGESETAFYCKLKSTSYEEIKPKVPAGIYGWMSFEEEFLIPAPQISGWMSFEEQI